MLVAALKDWSSFPEAVTGGILIKKVFLKIRKFDKKEHNCFPVKFAKLLKAQLEDHLRMAASTFLSENVHATVFPLDFELKVLDILRNSRENGFLPPG